MADPANPVPETDAMLAAMAPRLQAYLSVLLGSVEEAEDVVQEVSLKFLKRAPEGDPASLEAWLLVTARNDALNRRRSARRRTERERTRSRETVSQDPAEDASRRESNARISSCLSGLPDELRELVYLKFVENRSLSQLADLVGLPKSTVALRVQEGLMTLNRCFHGGGA